MLPPWMIERLERARREREADRRPALEIEIRPEPGGGPARERPEERPARVVVIQVW